MIYPDYSLEDEAKSQGYNYVVGVDEVGRGALALCVVAAAVYIPDEVIPLLIGKVNDSKKLSSKKREELFEVITSKCDYNVGIVEADVIDKINILEATKLAMSIAVSKLLMRDYLLVDGTVDLTKHISCPQRRVIKGDTVSISIAAASVVAKVVRDRIAVEVHKEFPIYGFEVNKAYGTKKHIEAIQTYGPSPYHRLTFNKVGR